MSKQRQILLLHGALGASADFEAFVHAYRYDLILHTYEFSGHGKKSLSETERFTIESMADELIQFLEKKDNNVIEIFGYSMGGYVALYAASQKSDLCQSITTLGTKFDWNPEFSIKESAALDPIKIKEIYPSWAEMLIKKHGQTKWEELVIKTSNLIRDLGNNPRLHKDQLLKIQVPCKITRGSKDKMVNEIESKIMSSWIPKAIYLEVKDMPHALEKYPLEILNQVIQGKYLTNIGSSE